MRSKMVSIIFCAVLVANIFAPIAIFVGDPGPSSSGTGGLANSPWPMFRNNLNHTGLSPYDTSANPGKLKWNFTTGSNVFSSPAIGSDGTIYIGSLDSKLYAISPDGTEKWNFTTGNDVHSSPAIGSDGTIYVGSDDYKLYAINPDDTEKWNFTTGGTVRSSPAIGYRGTIYFGSNDKKLYAINPDGTEKWNFTTGGYVYPSPAIGYGGTIYVGSNDKKLYAINPDGTEKWNFTTGSVVSSSPAIGPDGTIYVGSHDNKLYAINSDGTEKWNFTTGQDVHSSPAIGSDGTIYVGSRDNKLYAINSDGTEKWNFTTGFIVHSSPAIGSDGTIYVGSMDYKLYAIGKPSTPPIAKAGLDQTVNEGDVVQFNGTGSYDPDGTIESYEWDFDISDGLWWETSAVPDATSPTPTHIYGDNGLFIVTLRVTDDDNLTAVDTCNITVLNVDPTVTIESAIMDVEIGLRVAGRKYNDVGMTLYEDGNPIGYVSIERMPGSPNAQMAWIPVTLDMTKSYSATVTYTPEDPPNIGANPVWIYIKSENGSINKIHHTFNIQQSKKRDSEHWNHVEPWEVDLNAHLIGHTFELTSHITDPGSDDENLTYIYGSQNAMITYLNNPPSPDPYPSPEVNLRDIVDTIYLVYEGPGTLSLLVEDDDGGTGTTTIDLA